ncbi:MAG: hypothetical protein MJE68_25645 [Proteobacteria bacterium]|nr:hypothetical protein [Pseudomonadota bacterium]
MERNADSAAGSIATRRGTAILSLKAYQAIRAVVAEEVAMSSHSSSAAERGAVSRESSRDPGSAHGTIVVRQTFLNLVSIYNILMQNLSVTKSKGFKIA